MHLVRKLFKKPANKFLLLTILYIAVGFIFTLIMVSKYNSTIIMGTQSESSGLSTSTTINEDTATTTSLSSSEYVNIPTESAITQNTKLTVVPENAKDIAFSFDDQFCTYINNKSLYIVDVIKDKIINTIQEKYEISNVEMMSNRNIILYCMIYRSSKSSSDTLILKTYNLENGSITEQKSFEIPKGAVVRKLDYSSVTSHVFFDIRSGLGPNEHDAVYSLDIMKRLNKKSFGSTINQMVALKNSVSIYYDKSGQLFCDTQIVPELLKKEIQLLGCDGKDNIFLQSLAEKSILYILSQKNQIKTIDLKDPGYSQIYSDKQDLYAIYKDHIINLSSDDMANLSYDQKIHFIGMSGSYIYFFDEYGTIKVIPKDI